jgi:hypothetical protein
VPARPSLHQGVRCRMAGWWMGGFMGACSGSGQSAYARDPRRTVRPRTDADGSGAQSASRSAPRAPKTPEPRCAPDGKLHHDVGRQRRARHPRSRAQPVRSPLGRTVAIPSLIR